MWFTEDEVVVLKHLLNKGKFWRNIAEFIAASEN